jgi:hypothetical protein
LEKAGSINLPRKYKFANYEDKAQKSLDVCHCLVLAHQEIQKIFAQFPVVKKKSEIDTKISSIFG